ncbi:MAG TPA: LamG-like jellyroll fold domain-containing protein [Planctomycetota bacterium]
MPAVLLLLLAALDEPRTPLDAFKAAVREAKSAEDKARLLLAFGAAATPDAAAVAELSRFLNPAPGDLRFVLPTTSAAILGRLRGSKEASRALERALPVYAKVPCVQRKLVAALARVGHASSTAALDAILRGPDLDLALFTVATLPDLPADLSLDALIRAWEWMESRRPKVGDDVKNGFNRLEAEILKQVQGMSGEKYPTMTEMSRWWSKHATTWIARARLRDRDKSPDSLPAEPPPALILEFGFNERAGTTAANTGVASAWVPSGVLTRNRPAWSGDVPPSGGAGSLDWGQEPGAVDVAGVAEHLRDLPAFSVTGWVCCRGAAEGAILSWLDRDGVEIVRRADGSLQAGINQRAEASDVRTPPGLVGAIDERVPNAVFDGWRFFALTSDAKEIRIYVGARDRDAAPVVIRESTRGKVGSRVAATLSIGNVPQRGAGRGFRGLIDEVRIFAGALPPAEVVRIQGR